MFRLVVCFAFIVLCALVFSSEGTSNITSVECPPLPCKVLKPFCAHGWEKDANGCKLCKCHNPCETLTEVPVCEENEKCVVEKAENGEFIGKCQKKVVKRDMKNRCRLPKVTGPCRKAMSRYYFDSTTKQCESFIYGGCKGNTNNFLSKRTCESTCRKGF